MGTHEITVNHVPDPTMLSAAERQVLLVRFDAIANQIWRKPPDLFQRLDSWVCAADTGLLLARTPPGEIVGFSVYRRLTIDAAFIIHRETTNVLPVAQDRGVWTAFTRRLLAEVSSGAPRRPLHLAWRTRNPVIYTANYRYCEAVAPDLLGDSTDRALGDLAARAAERLYPHVRLQRSSMVMVDAYGGVAYREPPRHRDALATARFFAVPDLDRPENALFALGRVRG